MRNVASAVVLSVLLALTGCSDKAQELSTTDPRETLPVANEAESPVPLTDTTGTTDTSSTSTGIAGAPGDDSGFEATATSPDTNASTPPANRTR